MPGVRAKDKGRIEGWVRLTLLDRVRKAAGRRSLNDTDVLSEALTDWADKHETTETTTEGDPL
jgi:hypothetical protein